MNPQDTLKFESSIAETIIVAPDIYEEDESGDETVDRLENLSMAQRLLELPATELGFIERTHCELWLDTDFEPTVGQAEYLEAIYAACEREANLAGRKW